VEQESDHRVEIVAGTKLRDQSLDRRMGFSRRTPYRRFRFVKQWCVLVVLMAAMGCSRIGDVDVGEKSQAATRTWTVETRIWVTGSISDCLTVGDSCPDKRDTAVMRNDFVHVQCRNEDRRTTDWCVLDSRKRRPARKGRDDVEAGERSGTSYKLPPPKPSYDNTKAVYLWGLCTNATPGPDTWEPYPCWPQP